MIDMNDLAQVVGDAYHTPAQTLSDGDVAWACLVGGGIMTLVFAVLAVVSFLRHGARGNPLVVSFAIGASAALFLCISDGLCQLPKVGTDDTTATVSAARKRPDGFGERLERVREWSTCHVPPGRWDSIPAWIWTYSAPSRRTIPRRDAWPPSRKGDRYMQ